MDCARVCPVEGCLGARALGRVRIAPWLWPLLVVALWFGIIGVARLTGNWETTIPVETFRQVINSGLLEASTPMF
jgi:hypothetical protein